jgi:hypothetical protein
MVARRTALLAWLLFGWVSGVAFFVWPRGDSGSIMSAAWSLVTVPSLATFWTLVFCGWPNKTQARLVPKLADFRDRPLARHRYHSPAP